MTISNKQRIAMAVIVIVGLAAGGAVLLPKGFLSKGQTAGAHTDAHADEHAEAGHSELQPHSPEAHAEATSGGGAGGGPKPSEHGERQIHLTEAQTKAAGIEIRSAGPGRVQLTTRFQGEIRFDEDRTSHVVPRVAGVAKSVSAQLGQQVRQGQVLAVIASASLADQRSEWATAQKRREAARLTYEREKSLWEDRISAQQDYQQARAALQEADIAVENAIQKLAAVGANGSASGLNRLEIRAPFAGTVVEKHLGLGEAVKEDASIFTLSDLGSVWAEFAVAPKDLATVRVGQRVVVSSTAFESQVEGEISYVGALLGEQTRTARARVTLTNPDGAWRPGLFVTVAVMGEAIDLPLTVPADAVQTIDHQPTLFAATADGFVPTPVKPGRSDGKSVEILDGLAPGDRYAATRSFILKSELGKASAEHGH